MQSIIKSPGTEICNKSTKLVNIDQCFLIQAYIVILFETTYLIWLILYFVINKHFSLLLF